MNAIRLSCLFVSLVFGLQEIRGQSMIQCTALKGTPNGDVSLTLGCGDGCAGKAIITGKITNRSGKPILLDDDLQRVFFTIEPEESNPAKVLNPDGYIGYFPFVASLKENNSGGVQENYLLLNNRSVDFELDFELIKWTSIKASFTDPEKAVHLNGKYLLTLNLAPFRDANTSKLLGSTKPLPKVFMSNCIVVYRGINSTVPALEKKTSYEF